MWTTDEWRTSDILESSQIGNHISYADLPLMDLRQGTVSFTLFWTEELRWEGRNFDVAITGAD